MSTKALFISVADLKKRSIIDGNVDSSKIADTIKFKKETRKSFPSLPLAFEAAAG